MCVKNIWKYNTHPHQASFMLLHWNNLDEDRNLPYEPIYIKKKKIKTCNHQSK